MPTSALVDPGERTGSVSTRSRSADTDKGWVGCVFVHRKGEGMVWEVKREGGMEGKKATTAGFELARAKPNRFRVCLLNHSDKLSVGRRGWVAMIMDRCLGV